MGKTAPLAKFGCASLITLEILDVITMKEIALRLLSYNIHKGFASQNRKFVLRQIKEAIQIIPADIVFLQEVLGHHSRHGRKIKGWPTISQFEYLAETIWPHFTYGKNAVYTYGHHGN